MARRTDAAPTQEQLPFWPDHLRGVPHGILRGALFAAFAKGRRKQLLRAEIAVVGDYKVIYTGHQLDQADLDVFEQVMHLARERGPDEPVRFRVRAFLRSVGRSYGTGNVEWLKNALARLKASAVEIYKPPMAFVGSLVDDITRDEATGEWSVMINPRLAALYRAGWGQVHWQRRLQLARQPLAQWLHGFTANLEKPLTFAIDRLQELSGSSYARRRDFVAALDHAFEAVRAIGHAVSYTLEGRDKIRIHPTRPAVAATGTASGA